MTTKKIKKECKKCLANYGSNCYMNIILDVCQNNLQGVKNIKNITCEYETEKYLNWNRCKNKPKTLYQYKFDNWVDEKTGKLKVGLYCKLHYKQNVIWHFERG